MVAVTGAEGFIGSHLVEGLVTLGARVRAMVQYNAFDSWGWLETLDRRVMESVEVVLGDVRDPGSVLGFMRDAEVVYHLAALIGIPYSYRAPHSYLATNAGGTLNVLESARALGTARVVHTSTSEVYGTALSVPIDERHPLQAQSPYSASKVAADKLVESFHLSFALPVVTLRPFNTYGPRQSTRAVIPTIVTQLLAGARVLKLGLLTPTRDFSYVADTVAAFLAVGRAPDEAVLGQVLNAGSGTETSIGQLVTRIAELTGCPVEAVEEEEERLRPSTSEVLRLVSDSGELRRRTGWAPATSLEDGLRATVAWFREPANLARYRPGTYSV